MSNRNPNQSLPASGADLITDRKYKPDALRAVGVLRRAKPWRGTPDERLAKLRACSEQLSAIYGVHSPTVVFAPGALPMWEPELNVIQLDRLSVVTFLHLFCCLRGMKPRERFAWSLSLFRRCFPVSFARCTFEGLWLRNANATH